MASWFPRTRCIRAPSEPYASRNASNSLSRPASVRSPLTRTASGSSGAHLVDHGAVHDLRVRRLARLGAEDRAELLLAQVTDPSALDLAEMHVVGGRDRRQQAAGGTLERRERGRQPLVGRGAVDVELVLGSRLEAVDAGGVVRTGRDDLGVADARCNRPVSRRSRNVTTASSGPTVISSASCTTVTEQRVRLGRGGRCVPTGATAPAADRRAGP